MQLQRRIGAFAIADSALAQLSAADRKVVLTSFQATAAKLLTALRTADADAETHMKGQGLAVVATPADLRRAFDAAAQKTWQRLAGVSFEQQDLDTIIKLRDVLRPQQLAAAPQAQATQSAQGVLRIATLAPAGSDREKMLLRLAADIDEKTEQRVTLKLYLVGVGGDEKDFVQKMSKGQLDGAELTSYGLSMIDPTISVLELPGMFASIEETDYAVDKMWPYLQKKYGKARVVLAAREEVGWLSFYSQHPIDSLAVLGKASFWLSPDDGVLADLYSELGISHLIGPASVVNDAFAKHQIDTCYGTPTALVANHWSAAVSSRSTLALGYRVGAIVITSAAMGQLSTADQATVLALMKKAATKLRTVARRDNVDAQRAIQQHGLITVTSTEVSTSFDAAAQKTWQNLVGTLYSKQELADVLTYRQEYRKAHASP
jgi:TRAP-type C4-dicarboxylate transport system substrate-binding protein